MTCETFQYVVFDLHLIMIAERFSLKKHVTVVEILKCSRSSSKNSPIIKFS